jgi:hypothetical protein
LTWIARVLSALLAVAVLGVAAGTAVVHPKPAHAAGAACWFSDTPGIVYTDWYASASQQVFDASSGGTQRTIYTDLQAYRYSGGNGFAQDGHCYRAYYTSAWTGDGSGGYFHSHLRMWVCGTFVGSDDSVTSWGDRSQTTTQNFGTSVTAFVTLPSGQGMNLQFYDYGTGCNPQADQLTTDASSPTWSAHPTSDGNLFYAHF